MFFCDQRQQFFKPLTSKYREQVIECLRLLYERLYSANADYGHSLKREQLIEIFEEALVRAPLLDEGEGEAEQRFKNNREQAGWILNQLIEHGWIEKQVDHATLQSSYPFSRVGRLFTEPLVAADSRRVRTRHRNTRNTLNSLEAFLARGEVHDLLDAFEYSERIIADFTDVIAELEERKRELVREVESQVLVQQATDQFFDFMEKRFQPDLSVRLSADSVEKHRDNIARTLSKIQRKERSFKAGVERDLRQLVPELVAELTSERQSLMLYLLDTIELRMRRAAEVMLPALRNALHSFTKRADIIIRQLSYLHAQQDSDLLGLCHQLAALPVADSDARLLAAAEQMAATSLSLIDPAQIKLKERRQRQLVITAVAEQGALDREAQRELMIQQLLDQAFSFNDAQLKLYVQKSLRDGRRINTRELEIDSAPELLAMAHIIELGAINHHSSEFQFIVTPLGGRGSNEYYLGFDDFSIELVANQAAESRA